MNSHGRGRRRGRRWMPIGDKWGIASSGRWGAAQAPRQPKPVSWGSLAVLVERGARDRLVASALAEGPVPDAAYTQDGNERAARAEQGAAAEGHCNAVCHPWGRPIVCNVVVGIVIGLVVF
eukprot:scaffold18211_cov124-Isochrysis_galbana.AAC.3